MKSHALAAVAALIAATASARAEPPDDPYFASSGTWGQSYADQWGLKRIGFEAAGETPDAWTLANAPGEPVIVAVIDTGLDYLHPDIARENLWVNEKERANGVDDDRNGYVDDLVGWNFVDADENPWDVSGHGTLVAGVIGAANGNGRGVAGVNPRARLMVLKVLNVAGQGRSSHIAAAIQYAVAHGARVINLSLGGEDLSGVEELAIRRAAEAGVLIVVAAGNFGRDTAGFGFADLPNVVTVAASDPRDRRARFSNWGRSVKVTAPGVDILGLRARGADFVWLSAAAERRAGAAAVGDGQYYRASGTSFAAAFVSGAASWLMAHRPGLTGVQAARLIVQSARDIGPPGIDRETGYGLIDARAALSADPELWIDARIDEVDLAVRDGETRIRVLGTAAADRFAGAHVRVAPEAYPDDWIELSAPIAQPVTRGVLAELEPRFLRGSRRWIVQLVTSHAGGGQRESRFVVDLGTKR